MTALKLVLVCTYRCLSSVNISPLYYIVFYSCNMATSDLPDMYAQGPRAVGIHIRQIMSAHVTNIM